MARRSKISVPLRINPYSQESVGLQACIVATPTGMLDLVQGIYGVRAGTADSPRTNEERTIDAYFDGNADQYSVATGTIADATNPFTIVWEAQLDSHTDSYPMLAHFQRGVFNAPLRVFYSSDAAYSDISFGYATAERLRATLPSGISRTGQRHWGVWSFLGGTFTTTTNHRLIVNGLSCAITTTSNFATITDSTRVGGASSTTADWNGAIRQARLYNRAWGEDEALRFWHPSSRDELFSPPRRKIFLGVVAGGGTSDAVGSSAGVGTASGVGASIAASVGSSAGVATASAVGADASSGTSDAVGTSAGVGAASGVGASTAAAVGSSASIATATAEGVAVQTIEAVGTAAGVATASAVGSDGLAVETVVQPGGVKKKRVAGTSSSWTVSLLSSAALPKHGSSWRQCASKSQRRCNGPSQSPGLLRSSLGSYLPRSSQRHQTKLYGALSMTLKSNTTDSYAMQ